MPPRLALSVLLGAVLASGSMPRARAEDAVGPPAPPPPHPKARPAIAHPYLDSLVGSWEMSVEVNGMTLKGRSRWTRALEGTALVEELVVDEGLSAFYGLGVLYVGPDGKSVTHWWFDTAGRGEVQQTQGPLEATGFESTGTWGTKKIVHRFSARPGGHLFEMSNEHGPVVKATYVPAPKEHPVTPVPASRGPAAPLVDRLLGDWNVKGDWTFSGRTIPHEGRTTYRLVVGGAYLLQDYDVKSAVEHSVGLGISSIGADGTKGQTWLFGNYFDEPYHLQTTWAADGVVSECATGYAGAFTIKLRLTGSGHHVDYAFPTLEMTSQEDAVRPK